jgi:hypothetical protein
LVLCNLPLGLLGACQTDDGGASPSAKHDAKQSAAHAEATAQTVPSPAAASAVPTDTPGITVPVRMPQALPPPSARPLASSVAQRRDVLGDYGFPAYGNLTHLCARRVYEPGGDHVTWDAFASTDSPQRIVTAYRKLLGERGLTTEEDSTSWKLPAESSSPNRILTILPPKAQGPHHGCDVEIPTAARSVVIASRRR